MSEKAGPELDAKLAELMGWKVCRNESCEGCDDVMFLSQGEWYYGSGGLHFSTRINHAISAAEELRKAGKIDAWDIHQFETSSASTGRLMPNGRTLAWADALQGDSDSADPRAHALTLALVAALEPVESRR